MVDNAYRFVTEELSVAQMTGLCWLPGSSACPFPNGTGLLYLNSTAYRQHMRRLP
jgi:hypothetical protein